MGAFSELDMEREYCYQNADDPLPGFGDDENEDAFEADEGPYCGAEPEETPSAKIAAAEQSSLPAGEPKQDEQTEDEKRKAHEEAEARRKAEFDAKQQARREKEAAELARVAAMSDDEVTAASMQRVGADTEKLTRRNMKECVAEYIQTRCIEDPAFARLTMHPLKSMIHCFWYINRKVREFVEQEMKDNDIRPHDVNGVYGSDVPDDMCYQWAEDYFRDPDAEEDHRDEEKFVPKPYYGKTSASKAKKAKEPKKKDAPKPKPRPEENNMQVSLLEAAS